MSDDLLDKYARRTDAAGEREPSDEAEDFGCFGWLRGVRDRALMLELRRKDGHALAVGYAWMDRVEFEPDAGITLHLPGRRVRITGTRLNSEARPTVRLFDGIVRHRVPWIREMDRAECLQATGRQTVIERIEWES